MKNDIEVSVERQPLRDLRERAQAGPPYDPVFLASLESDARAGARALYRICRRAETSAASEEDRLNVMMRFENQVKENGFSRIAGVDEAGRGPLAGPIVAAAVILGKPLPGLDDSKKLSAAQRDRIYDALIRSGYPIGVAVVEAAAIDRHGIQSANYTAMAQAVAAIEEPPDFLLVDGFAIPGCPLPQKRLVKGDRRSASIAAASIIAKVTRDRLMDELDRLYPAYGFARHKGYGTSDHLAALQRFGPCPVHRRSFSPLKELGSRNYEL